MGDTPGGAAVLLPWPGSVPYSARPGLMCLSTLDVPVAGGELAHRGTCPTLVLYLFKRNTPQIKVSPAARTCTATRRDFSVPSCACSSSLAPHSSHRWAMGDSSLLVGYAAVFGAIIAFGSFGVPIKSPAVLRARVHPLGEC